MTSTSQARFVNGLPVLRVRPLPAVLAALVLLYGGAAPSVASACSLDGIASISVNGDVAVRTTDAATAATLASWAPFTFGLAFAPGVSLRFAEDLGKLRRSLPAAALAIPFRWEFGDGAAGRGMAAAHRYPRVGWYRVAVRGYWPSRRVWVLFDSVRVHILPAGALGQANFGYRIVLALAALTRVLAYGGWLLIFVVPLAWRVVARARRRRRRSRPAPSG